MCLVLAVGEGKDQFFGRERCDENQHVRLHENWHEIEHVKLPSWNEVEERVQ